MVRKPVGTSNRRRKRELSRERRGLPASEEVSVSRKRPRQTMPKYGNSFAKTDLPKVSGEMYARMAQIYGIPVKDLTPVRIFSGGQFVVPMYRAVTHSVSSAFKRGALDHEMLHSLQIMLMRARRMKEKQVRAEGHAEQKDQRLSLWRDLKEVLEFLHPTKRAYDKKFSEPAADTGVPYRYQVIQALGTPTAGLIFGLGLVINPKIGIPLALATAVPGTFRRVMVRRYYKKHGADGLILLFAEPPQKFDLLNLREKEKEFVEKGYLEPKGGLTRKGRQYLKRLIPRGRLIERIEEFEKYRQAKEE